MKVPIKIAVCVNGDGDWNSCGWKPHSTDLQVMESDYAEMWHLAQDGAEYPAKTFWITAEVKAPTAEYVKGMVFVEDKE